uniref:VP7 n=1 Tax=viral metagenome TaxID=1070528 RepID=A0A2V0RCW2_9ZZZZ
MGIVKSDSESKKSKANQLDKRLVITRLRTIMGAFIVGDFDTDMDPNAHLMRKAHSRIRLLSNNDLTKMCEEYGYSLEKGLAYIEAVTQMPEHMPGSLAYTSRAHPLPTHGPTEVDILNIQWFDNAWTNNSWDKLSRMHDGGPPSFWTKNFHDKDDQFKQSFETYNALYPGRGVRIGYDKYPTYDIVLSELVRFLLTFPLEEKHVWIQGELDGMSTTETLRRLRNDIVIAFSRPRAQNSGVDPNVTSYWQSSVVASYDLYYYYGGRTIQRIPVVPWRASNFGMRVFAGALAPQIFPPTTLMHDLNIDARIEESNGSASGPMIYANYSGHVELVPIHEEDYLDFAWHKIGDNRFIMQDPRSWIPSRNDGAHLYKIADTSFFNGLGSVCTCAHAVYGIGRSEPELWEQLQRKLSTGHDTSGHMLAAPVMHTSHMLWYLHEVYTNIMREASIYNLSFKEPTDGLYHTMQEYEHAIQDMHKLDRNRMYPFYARRNIAFCTEFIRALV